ncbi:hypothetical protein K438DRAFT_1756600 [Mycena galopus ATCC 62051]|nr:hypothetical protein K438DRAFT_1756600 [Mycena galopus ATCC 62051]
MKKRCAWCRKTMWRCSSQKGIGVEAKCTEWFEALCLLAEVFNAWIQPYINTNLLLSEQIKSLVLCSHLICGLYLQNGASFMSNQLYAHIQASVQNAVLMVPKTWLINGELKVFICLLGDDVLEALFGRSRMIGGHSPNCSIAELQDRFTSAMTLDWIYEQYPEFEREPRRLNMSRMRRIDHLRPRHFQRGLRAKSCDLPAVWKSAVRKAEGILAKYGVQMVVPFSILFKKPKTDLLRPFGGKYPALSSKPDRSLVDSTSADSTDSPAIDPGPFNPSILIPTTEFDRIFAEMEANTPPGPHSLFAAVNDSGQHTRSQFHDWLPRVRCFTYGGKTSIRASGEENQTLSAATHFQLGDLFTTLISYNNTHLALAIAKCTLIKKGLTGSKASSISAVSRAELSLPNSMYTISGQVFSVVPFRQADGCQIFAWDGNFVSFSLKKKGQVNGAEVSRIRNLQFAVTSRLIDSAIHGQAREVMALDSEVPGGREKTWAFSPDDLSTTWSRLWDRLLADTTLHNKFPIFTGISDGVFPYTISPSPDAPAIIYCKAIAGTTVEQTHLNRSTCRVCSIPVKDTNRQVHIGQHILKSMCGVPDPSVKSGISKEYPCGTCAGPTVDGGCKAGIKNGKLNSDCPLRYPFMVSAAKQFRDTRPCTNVLIKCPLDCEQFHWKYNFHQHLQERHPQWSEILSQDFLSTIQIGSAEQEALGIPRDHVRAFPSPNPPAPSSPHRSRGHKRSVSSPPTSPSHRSNKENKGVATSSSEIDVRVMRASKIRKLIFSF